MGAMRYLSMLLLCTVTHLQAQEEHFLSFIIPCYNCSATVKASIDSIYEQKLRCPFELICTDDGSSDHTYQLLLDIQKEHPEMKVYRHEKNLGGGPARNTCVKNSHGDLIFCLDSDNLLAESDSVQRLIDFLDEKKGDVACFGSIVFFKGDVEIQEGRWDFSAPEGRYSVYDILSIALNPPASGNYLFSRKSFDAVGGYSDLYVLDTLYFGFEQAYRGFPIFYLPGTYYLHRYTENSYYTRGARAGLLDKDFLSIVLAHPELFTAETLAILKQASKTGKFSNGWDYPYILNYKILKFSNRPLLKEI